MSEPIRNDGDENGLLGELGAQMLVRFAGLLRAGRIYDVSNQAFQRQLQEFMAVLLRGMEEENEIALVAVADHFYLNGVRIKASASLLPVVHAMLGELERRSLGGIRFIEGFTAPEVERFLQLFLAGEDSALTEEFTAALTAASITHVVPVEAVDVDPEELTRELEERKAPAGERTRAKRVFWRAVLGTKKILLRATQSGRPDLRQAKRLVQPVVDSIMKNEYSIVGLTALKDHDEYTYAHCVNVSVLSVSMGQVLGLPRQSLADLGVAGLLHDIGKIAVPSAVLQKPAALSPEEWAMVRRHPLEGVKMMVRMPGLSSLTLDTLRVCMEHHLNHDRTGYPEFDSDWSQATFSRIVAVADCFDAVTAHRAYHTRPRTPFEGLQYLLGPARVQFDPAVLWALVRTVGLYPAGTVMLTASNHVVLSMSPNPEDLSRPHCRVLVHPDGSLAPEEGAEMWDPMPPEQSALRVLRPEEHQLQTGELLAA